MESSEITLAAALECVGDRFRIDVDDGSTIELELTEAARARITPSGEQADTSFSMLFLGPVSPMLEQGTLPLNHDTWGLSHVFLVPVNQDAEGTYYEAAFNRA